MKGKPRWKRGVKMGSGLRNLKKQIKQVNHTKYTRKEIK
ncbi:hypothetical protein B834_1376 [Enterococcus mundtii 1A]|nr:hypothetical protein [Enterococcus mundtii 1A]